MESDSLGMSIAVHLSGTRDVVEKYRVLCYIDDRPNEK